MEDIIGDSAAIVMNDIHHPYSDTDNTRDATVELSNSIFRYVHVNENTGSAMDIKNCDDIKVENVLIENTYAEYFGGGFFIINTDSILLNITFNKPESVK